MQFNKEGGVGYRCFLKSELEKRCNANPRYSLRAFARDLGLDSARLSLILNGKQGLSEKTAKAICARLMLSRPEAELFCQQVLASDSRSKRQRELANQWISQKKNAEYPVRTLQEDQFKVISDWYHYAILELTSLRHFEEDPDWIAKRLGISRYEAQAGLERLTRLGLLERVKGKLCQTDVVLTTPEDTPSRPIQEFSNQILKKAQSSIYLQGTEERDLSTLTIAINREDLKWAKEEIRRFRRALNRELERRGSKTGRDEVYCLAIQFFRLTESS